MKKTAALLLASALGMAVAVPATAQEQGDMTIGLGIGWVNPTDSYSTTAAGQVRVDDNIRPTLTFEYFIADRIGLEVLAAWPFEHTASVQGAGDAIKTKHLPPTVSVNYHFVNNSNITPFVGVGLNYTHFFDERPTGILAPGTAVSLDDSFGIALNAGLDWALSENSALRTNVRWIDINTDAKVGGTPIGRVEIDPWVVQVAYVHKF